ncbi:MAG: CBS domain-containing protein [Bacillota bacterium]
MYVSNRMTPNPVTVSPKTTALKALDLMQQHRFSNLPVVENGKMLGIIAKEDIINQYFCGEKGMDLVEDKLVEELMTRDFTFVRKLDYLEKAVYTLMEKDVSALPVLDKEDKLVGIITRADVLNAFADTMGVDNKGTRLYIIAPDFVGQIAKIANIVKHHGVSIEAMSVFDSGIINTKQIIMKVDSKNVDHLIAELKHSGVDVRDSGSY